MISERQYKVAVARVSTYRAAEKILKESTIQDEDPVVIDEIPAWLSENTGLYCGDIVAVEKVSLKGLLIVKAKPFSRVIESKQWIPKSQVVVSPASVKHDLKLIKEYKDQ